MKMLNPKVIRLALLRNDGSATKQDCADIAGNEALPLYVEAPPLDYVGPAEARPAPALLLSDEIRQAVGILRVGDATPLEQKAVFAKVIALCKCLAPIERGYREITDAATEEAEAIRHWVGDEGPVQ